MSTNRYPCSHLLRLEPQVDRAVRARAEATAQPIAEELRKLVAIGLDLVVSNPDQAEKFRA